MGNLEALRCAVRISDDIHPTFSAPMRQVGNILYDEYKRGIVADKELAGKQRPRDIAFHEEERMSILCTILPCDVKSSVRKQLMAPTEEMMEDALGDIGDFRFYVAATENREAPTPFVYRAENDRKNRLRRESWHLPMITMEFLRRFRKINFEMGPWEESKNP